MKELSIDVCYHPEYGGDVYQPRVPGYKKFIEPYVTAKEARAYLRGVKDQQAEIEDLKAQRDHWREIANVMGIT